MSDHYHYEYASDRHDHRGQYADERHDHYRDYAEYNHDHRDLDSLIAGLREDLSRAQERIRELEERDELDGALDRIAALEAAKLRLTEALRGTAAGEESVCRAGMASDERLAIASDLEEEFTALAAALAGEPDDEPGSGPGPERPETWAFPGPEDEGSEEGCGDG